MCIDEVDTYENIWKKSDLRLHRKMN